MKKLMFAIAAVAAGVALADVEGANTVGYIVQPGESDTYQMVAPMFQAIGGTVKLSDIKVASKTSTTLKLSNFQIIFFGTDGSPAWAAYDETLKTQFPEIYEVFGNEEDAYELSFYYHQSSKNWFLTGDESREYPINDYPIAAGRGFELMIGDGLAEGVEVTYAGQVANEALPMDVDTDCYFESGNIAPATKKLSDFLVESKTTTTLKLSNFQLIFFGTDGSPAWAAYDETLKTQFPEIYEVFGNEEDAYELSFYYHQSSKNWFLTGDESREYPINDYPVVAGRGFNLMIGDGLAEGVTFTLPAALEKNDK